MRTLLITASLLLTLAATPLLALNIATIDEKLFENSKVVQDIKRQIEEKRDEFQKEVQEKEKDLLEKDESLAKERDLISKDAFETKAKEFRSQFVEAQRLLQTRRSQLENANLRTTTRVRKEIESIIAEIAKEKGFDLAISRSRLLYGSDSLDISQDVLSELDKRLPSIELIFDGK